MKPVHAWSVAGLLFVSAVCLARAPLPQEPDDAFHSAFQKALDAGQKPEQLKLVKADPRNAELWIVRAAEAVADDPAAKEKALLEALSAAWTENFKTAFPERETKYLAGLDAGKKKTRAELVARWKAAWRDFEGSLTRKEAAAAPIVDELDALSGAFDSEGDLFHASEAYRAFGICNDETMRGKSADLHRAWQAYGHAIEMREKLDLKDPPYDELTKRVAALVARGATEKGGGNPGAPEAKPELPKAPQGTAASVALSFEALTAPDAIMRPIYGCDEIYEIWNGVALQGKASVATFSTTSECPPFVRTGSSDIRFDLNDDKIGDEKIPMTGNITAVKVEIGREAKKRPWAFFAVTGAQKDSYQGIEVNLAPDDKQYLIYTLGAASVVGTIGTTQVRIIDDSVDGTYGNKPPMYGSIGVSAEHYEPWLDSIVVGNSKRARPWSEIQEIEGAFYKLEVQEQGAKLQATPVSPDTGVLKLDFKGPVQPNYVIVEGSSELKDCYYDLVEGGAKGVRVPVGNYSLYYGDIRRGKKKQMQKILILPATSSSPSWNVRKGETTTVALGAPFTFDFRYEIDGSKLKVKGKSVVVLGAAGERYERPWNCVSKPEVAWRKKGSKATLGEAKMQLGDNATINNKDLSWGAVWFPLDLETETKDKGNQFEVQLVQKKHDLFGKIESAWKD